MFEPICVSPTKEVTGVWERLRRLITRWYGPIPEPARSEDIPRLEAALGRSLPPTVVAWVELTEALKASPASRLLRDGRRIEPLPEYEALSLNLQSEGDVHWTVLYSDLDRSDPPVRAWLLDYDSEEDRFERFESSDCATVTEFAVTYLMSYFRSASGFRIGEPPDGLAADLERAGVPVGRLTGLSIFEGPGWIATLEDDGAFGMEGALQVFLDEGVQVEGLPEPLRALSARAGMRWGHIPR